MFSHKAPLGSLCTLASERRSSGTLIPMALLNPDPRECSYLSGFIDIFSMPLLTANTQSVQIGSAVYIFWEAAEKKHLCGYVVLNCGQKHSVENIKRAKGHQTCSLSILLSVFIHLELHKPTYASMMLRRTKCGCNRRIWWGPSSTAVKWRIPPSDPVLSQQSLHYHLATLLQ